MTAFGAKSTRVLVLALPLLFALAGPPIAAGGDVEWEPITEAEWALAPDPTRDRGNAVMLFEKVIMDDSKFFKSRVETKAYVTVYRRIKIFDPEGHDWGEVEAPYLRGSEKIEEIRARTVRPDGEETVLARADVFEKEIVKTKGTVVKQKSFSLPGVSKGCIVDYIIRYSSRWIQGTWLIQKEIPLLHGEYRWLFFRGRGLRQSEYKEALLEDFSPNYFWLYTTTPLRVEQLPSLQDPEEVRFTIDDVPGFPSEPHSPPDAALQAQLRCYYGRAADPDSFWNETTREMAERLEDFCKRDRRLQQALPRWPLSKPKEERIEAAYQWLQAEIENLSYKEHEDDTESILGVVSQEEVDGLPGYKVNTNVDDVLERGYGTQEDINVVFCHLLRNWGIEASMAYVADRDETFFIRDAKYWQFDRSLVAVPAGEGRLRFYSPGDQHLPSDQVAAVNEASHALVMLGKLPEFTRTPYSAADLNRTRRTLRLRLDGDSDLEGEMIERRTGHPARAIRLLAVRSAASALDERLRDQLEEGVPRAEIDSVSVEGADSGESEKPLAMRCHVRLPAAGQRAAGQRLILQPFAALDQRASPFQAETRAHPIAFDHAYEVMDALMIELGEEWVVEGLPADTTFANPAGLCQAKFESFGQMLSVQRLLRLERPLWAASDYAVVRELFRAYHGLQSKAVVLAGQTKSAP